MSGLIGRKIGMTSLFDENGKNIPCTVIEAGPCIVTQVRTEEVDGYDKKAKSSNKALDGHFKKAGTTAKRKVIEFQGFEKEYNLGDSITVEHFEEGEFVDVSGVSKGKGFQGVVKRHGGEKVKVQNLRVLKVVAEKNLLVVKGAIPGHKNSYITIQK